ERFKLTPKGASFTSQSETIARGDEEFRPVGMVIAPDGSLYISDWVDKSYPVHGKGRIWRLRMKQAAQQIGASSKAEHSEGVTKGLPANRAETDESGLLRVVLNNPS